MVGIQLFFSASPLQPGGMLEAAPRSPGWDTDVFNTLGVCEHIFYLLQCLACGVREHYEDVDKHRSAEYSEEQVCLPLDVDKGRRNEVAECKVESPVGRGRQGNSLSTDTQREELGGIDPGNGAPSGSKGGNEEIGACNDRLAGGTGDLPGLSLDAIETAWWSRPSTGSQQTGVHEEEGHHKESSDKKRQTSAPAVDPEKSWDCHGDVDHVLDAAGNKKGVSGQASHSKDISIVSFVRFHNHLVKYTARGMGEMD